MQSRMTLGRKAARTGAVLAAGALAVGAVSLSRIAALGGAVDRLAGNSLPGIYRAGRMESLLLEYRGNVWRHIGAADAADKQAMDGAIEASRANFEAALRAYQETAAAGNERDLLGKAAPACRDYMEKAGAVLALSRAGNGAEAYAKYRSEASAGFDYASGLVKQLAASNKAAADAESLSAEGLAANGGAIIWLLLIASALVSGAASLLFVRGLNGALRGAVAELNQASGQVSGSAAQISASSESLAHGASEQAASLEETSASTEEVNSVARKNSENALAAATAVQETAHQFTEANQLLENTVTAMAEIKSSSDKISRIIKTIDEIAFQTNILALNAAVEAARAGEAGMGFAVVADEVRNLAQRSAQAARDTAALIEESISRSAEGKAMVDRVAGAIRAVTEKTARIKTLVDEVSLGSQEQTRGIEQIARAVVEMEQLTQKTAASAEQSAAASKELNAQSQGLMRTVGKLRDLTGADAVRREMAATHKNATKARTPLAGGAPGLPALRAAVQGPPLEPPAGLEFGGSQPPIVEFAASRLDRSTIPLDEAETGE